MVVDATRPATTRYQFKDRHAPGGLVEVFRVTTRTIFIAGFAIALWWSSECRLMALQSAGC